MDFATFARRQGNSPDGDSQSAKRDVREKGDEIENRHNESCLVLWFRRLNFTFKLSRRPRVTARTL